MITGCITLPPVEENQTERQTINQIACMFL